jgi:hypothetical protein
MNGDFGSYRRAGHTLVGIVVFCVFTLRLPADRPISLVDNNQHA